MNPINFQVKNSEIPKTAIVKASPVLSRATIPLPLPGQRQPGTARKAVNRMCTGVF